jgi:hypothetical protein
VLDICLDMCQQKFRNHAIEFRSARFEDAQLLCREAQLS